MSFVITCPICGPRCGYEFRFGNEERGQAPDQNGLTSDVYHDYIHLHEAVAGPQKEWWYHKDGCGTWFTIWRDTVTMRQAEDPEVQ
ncbi:MAG: sarcosine oxidase subunit delta [Chloroflexi bacterium]|nr:sarcosine oxidase subunit delta [Chloroflexota bacterium]